MFNTSTSRTVYGNPRLSQFMIITPAVSIDRNCNNETTDAIDFDRIKEPLHHSDYDHFNILNNNIGNNKSPSRQSYRPLYTQNRNNLLSKTPSGFYTSSSWRWCTLLCAAMRCFGAGRSSNAPYTASFRQSYSQNGSMLNDNERFKNMQYTLPRRTRDHMNNLTYEL